MTTRGEFRAFGMSSFAFTRACRTFCPDDES